MAGTVIFASDVNRSRAVCRRGMQLLAKAGERMLGTSLANQRQ